MSWHEHARCRGVGPEIFFPTRGEDLAAAKLYCAACPVRRDCLEQALIDGEKYGVWGGQGERARRRMRRSLGYVNKPRDLDDILFPQEPAA